MHIFALDATVTIYIDMRYLIIVGMRVLDSQLACAASSQ